jgi:hypothetical protein
MDICPYHQPRTHGELGDREVRDKSLLTSFNIDGERFLNTSSEPREWLLRASATPSNGGRVLQKPYRGFSPLILTCLPTLASTISYR